MWKHDAPRWSESVLRGAGCGGRHLAFPHSGHGIDTLGIQGWPGSHREFQASQSDTEKKEKKKF